MEKFIFSKNARLMKTFIFSKSARLLGAILPNVNPCIIAVPEFLHVGIKSTQKNGLMQNLFSNNSAFFKLDVCFTSAEN